jgi:hypothetical protein
MSELKLAKLPDRKPVKIAITVSPNLNKKLDAYADAYKGAYGDAEKPMLPPTWQVSNFQNAWPGSCVQNGPSGKRQPPFMSFAFKAS